MLKRKRPWTTILVKNKSLEDIFDEEDAIADDDEKKECDFQGRRSFIRA